MYDCMLGMLKIAVAGPPEMSMCDAGHVKNDTAGTSKEYQWTARDGSVIPGMSCQNRYRWTAQHVNVRYCAHSNRWKCGARDVNV